MQPVTAGVRQSRAINSERKWQTAGNKKPATRCFYLPALPVSLGNPPSPAVPPLILGNRWSPTRSPGDHLNRLLQPYFFFLAVFFLAAFLAFFFVAMGHSFRLWLRIRGSEAPVLHLQSAKTGAGPVLRDFIGTEIPGADAAGVLRCLGETAREGEGDGGGSDDSRHLRVAGHWGAACQTSQSIQASLRLFVSRWCVSFFCGGHRITPLRLPEV